MCRRIAPVVGCRIGDITRPKSRLQSILIRPRLPALCKRAKGQTIIAVNRIGKRIILELEHGDRIVIEPRMTGLVLLDNAPNKKHIRLIFKLKKGHCPDFGHHRGAMVDNDNGSVPFGRPNGQLLFWDQRGLGVVSLYSPRQFRDELGPDRIGPDALQVTPKILKDRLGHSRRPIKVALMDQHLLSGVGNLYASEILHRAGIHPATLCNKLKPRHWTAIQSSMQEVLEEAILHQGSTLRDGTYRAAHDEPGGFQDRHRVYQRAGQKCLQCGKAEIVRIVQAQRSTFFCPACQR